MAYPLKTDTVRTSGITDTSEFIASGDGNERPYPYAGSAVWAWLIDKMGSSDVAVRSALGIGSMASEDVADYSTAAEVAADVSASVAEAVPPAVAASVAESMAGLSDALETPDYGNDGGTGDRTSMITVSTSAIVASGIAANLVDGATGSTTSDSLKFSASDVADHYLLFDFAPGAGRLITEATWKQSTTATHGTWQWQGSNDATTWVDIGAAFTLGGATSQTQTELASNDRGYRYYRLLGVSGTASATPWIQEVEFELGRTVINAVSIIPTSGTAGQVLVKTSDADYEAAWQTLAFAEERAKWAERARREDAENQLKYYADSTSRGASGNDGLSPSEPKDTIANMLALSPGATDGLGLASGGSWSESIDPASGIRRIMSYGEGTPPILDGAVTIDPGDFAASAHVDAGGVVYDVTLDRDPAGVYVSGDTYMMWEDGAWLVRKTSVAAVAATPGTFYLAQPNALSTPSLAYVHPFGSTDPTSDGKLYERTYRSALIELADTNKAIVEGLHIRRGMGAYGPVSAGRDTILRRVLSAYGGKHNIIFKSGIMEDCVAFDAEVDRSVLTDGGMIPFTIYQTTPAHLDFTLRRCFSIFPAGRRNLTQGFYNHGSSGTPAYHRRARYEQCASVRGGGLVVLCEQFDIDDHTLIDSLPGQLQVPNAADGAIRRALIQTTTAGTTTGSINLPSAGATAGKSIEIADCAVHVEDVVSGSALTLSVASICNVHHNVLCSEGVGSVAAISAVDGASSFTRNIVMLNRSGTNRIVVMNNDMVRDYNVYIAAGGGSIYWQDTVSGTAFTLAEWQSETGQDLNSVSLNGDQADELFLNGLAGVIVGDFRLNPRCRIRFGDGSLVIDNVGPREHYDWPRRAVLSGPPRGWPTFPVTESECVAYIRDPWAWDYGL